MNTASFIDDLPSLESYWLVRLPVIDTKDFSFFSKTGSKESFYPHKIFSVVHDLLTSFVYQKAFHIY